MEEQDNPIESDDFLVRIRPTFTSGGDWTGDAEVSVITSRDNNLTDSVFNGMELFVMMLLSSLPVMEEDEYVRETIYQYVSDHYEDTFIEFEPEDSVTVESSDDDNIIHLTFNTTTKGSA